MIHDDTKDKALKYLAETDEPAARARTLVKALEDVKASILAQLYLDDTESKNQKEREMRARCHDDFLAHLRKISDARIDYEEMHEKRNTARVLIETWRSENANRRMVGPL
jgi:hypothetical protein